MGRALLLRLLGAVLALLSSHVHCSSSSRRQLQQGSTITVPFENLPTLPAISWQQQPQPWQQQQQQQQPPQQQQQAYQQGPGQQSQYQLQQEQQGPGQQGPQQQQPQQQQPQQQQGNSQQGNMDNLAMSSSSQSDMAHAPSIGFGAPTLAASVGLQLPAYLQGAQMSQAFAPAPGPALGPAQGPEGMEFEKLQAAAPSADDEGGEVCLGATKQMVTGECLPFMAQFQLRGPALARMSDAAFRQAVAIGPTPTDQCCRDAKAFVSGGCSCNTAAAGFAPSIGMTQQELQLSARASVMACPHFSISDPCADA